MPTTVWIVLTAVGVYGVGSSVVMWVAEGPRAGVYAVVRRGAHAVAWRLLGVRPRRARHRKGGARRV